MTTDAEIRAWAKESGVDCPTRGMVPKAVRDQYEAARPEGDNPRLSPSEPAGEHGYAEAETAPTRPQGPTAGHPDEVAPTPPPSRFGSLRRAPGRGPAKTKTEHRRVSLEDLASGVWGALGGAAKSYGLVPTGRALEMQAPIAGMILEDTLRGTVVDKLAQPFARGGETMKELSALVGVPVLVTMISVKPETQGVAVPILRRLMRDWAIIAGPKIKAREKRERKALEALGVDEQGLDDLVDGWLSAMFAAPELADENEDQDQDAAGVRRA